MRKLHLLILLLFAVSICFVTACDDNDNNNNEEEREIIYSSADVDISKFRDQMPWEIHFSLPQRTLISIDILNCYADSINNIAHEDWGAGTHTIFYDPAIDVEEGVYCLQMKAIYTDTSLVYDKVFEIKTREFSNEFKQFAESHFQVEIYKDYEYQAAITIDHEENYFEGSRDDWFIMEWSERISYLPYNFRGDILDYYDDRFYSTIADFPEQFGSGWDDAINNSGYGISTFEWEGSSVHLDEYLQMYDQYQE